METTEKRKSVAPFYLTAVIWLAWALFLPLYSVWHYLLVGGLSLVAFVISSVLCRGEQISPSAGNSAAAAQTAGTSSAATASATAAGKTTGNAELDKLLQEGERSLEEMRRLDERIADPEISADIVRLERSTGQILSLVRQDPKKLSQIRRFLDYYLPTTLKLLHAYDRASSTGVSGDNINATMTGVRDLMQQVATAFEKQLDALFADEALDVSAEISVMESMMAREGLSGGAGDDFGLQF